MKTEILVTTDVHLTDGFKASGTSPPTDAKDVVIAQLTDELVKFLASQTAPCAEKHLLRNVRGRKQFKVPALRNLVADGAVIRSGSGKKGDPYLYALKMKQATAPTAVVVEEIII